MVYHYNEFIKDIPMSLRNFIYSGHLDDDEKILDTAHRHFFIYMKDAYKTFIFGMALPAMFFLFFPQAYFVVAIWGGIGVIGMLYHFVDWYFDAWLITNMGVLDIERNGLFDRTSTRIEYHMIEGLSYTIKGFWPTVLNFGDITLDKLGSKTTVILIDGASPKKVERMILHHQEEFVSDKSVRDHHALKDMLSEMIAYHVQNEKIKPSKKK